MLDNTNLQLIQFTNAMDAMKAAGGKIYYFVLDYGSEDSIWDKILYTFKQMFTISDTQLLIVDVPDTQSNNLEAVVTLVDRFCAECQGIIKYVNNNGFDSVLFEHAEIYISGIDDRFISYRQKAEKLGIEIRNAEDFVSIYQDIPFLTSSYQRKPLVSICIPTYNRGNCLKSILDSMIQQSEFQQGLVEVVVSDDASDDDTENIGRLDIFEMTRISVLAI